MHANRVPDKNLVSKIHNFSRGHDLTAEYRGEKRRRARVCARKRGREKRFFFFLLREEDLLPSIFLSVDDRRISTIEEFPIPRGERGESSGYIGFET